MVTTFTVLGIKFDNSSSIYDMCQSNYLVKLDKASSAVKAWSERDLTFLVKCTLIKTI
jgi:hypothetical protein